MKLHAFLVKEYLPHIQATLKRRTVDEYARLMVKVIIPHLGSQELSGLTTRAIDLWYADVRRDTPVQANRALAVLSSALSLAARWGHIPASPARGVRTAKEAPRERYLSRDEVGAMHRALDDETLEARVFVLLCLHTGARPGELLGADWAHLVNGKTLELPDSKTGRRTIYISALADALICKLYIPALGRPQRGPLFPNFHYKNVWRRVAKKADLDGVRLYDLRHTYASQALGAGVTLEQISQLLGHSNPQTTRRYAHLMPETGLEAAAKTSEAIEGLK